MIEYCPRHVGGGSVKALLAEAVHYFLMMPWRRGPSRAAGSWRCTRLGCWVPSAVGCGLTLGIGRVEVLEACRRVVGGNMEG